MNQANTSRLLDILNGINQEEVESFSKTYLTPNNTSFPVYIEQLISNKKLKRKDIFQKADLSVKYGYKLLTGEAHTADRDKLLRVFIAMQLTLKEVQRALMLYGMAPLYPKNRRDVIFIIAFNKSMTSVDTVNDWLEHYHEQKLSDSRE